MHRLDPHDAQEATAALLSESYILNTNPRRL